MAISSINFQGQQFRPNAGGFSTVGGNQGAQAFNGRPGDQFGMSREAQQAGGAQGAPALGRSGQ